MTLITIQDSATNAEYAEVKRNDFPVGNGFRATKAKVKKSSVSLVQLSDDEAFVDVHYNNDVISLAPAAVSAIGAATNDGTWTASDLYDNICAYLNI